jgi:hypothetical protein
MFETEADRLAYLQSLGGVTLTVRGQSFLGIFENPYRGVLSAQVDIEASDPSVTCRTSDVERCAIVKGDAIDGLPAPYRVKRHEPDGCGMSNLVLRA